MTLAAIAVSMPRTSTSTLEEETVFYTSANAVGWPRAYMTYLKTHPDEEVSADAFFAQEAAAQEEAGELARESVVYCTARCGKKLACSDDTRIRFAFSSQSIVCTA